MGGWVARSNGNKANLSPAEARLSFIKRFNILKKITIPVGSTVSGRWG